MTRIARFAGVSVAATALAQAGLLLGYGLLRWPVPAAVLLSLAVSAGPAYLLSRRLVWSDRCRTVAAPSEASRFLTIAASGALLSMGIVWAAVHVARTATSSHVTMSLVANASSIGATAVLWAARFIVLDRYLFR